MAIPRLQTASAPVVRMVRVAIEPHLASGGFTELVNGVWMLEGRGDQKYVSMSASSEGSGVLVGLGIYAPGISPWGIGEVIDDEALDLHIPRPVSPFGQWGGNLGFCADEGVLYWCHSTLMRRVCPDEGRLSVLIERDVVPRLLEESYYTDSEIAQQRQWHFNGYLRKGTGAPPNLKSRITKDRRLAARTRESSSPIDEADLPALTESPYGGETWQRLTSEPHLRGVEATRDDAGTWMVTVWFAEFLREEWFFESVESSLRAVDGVAKVRHDDTEVWLVWGPSSGRDLVAAVAGYLDESIDLLRQVYEEG